MNTKKEYPLIDIFKFIFAIGIVLIHSNFFTGELKSFIICNSFFRLGVPFFFTVSGLLLSDGLKNDNNNLGYIKKYIKRLLIPFLFYLLLNAPFEFISKYLEYKSIKASILYMIKGMLFYPWGAMWYILALIIASLICYYFNKKKKINVLVLISLFLYFFALICNNYYFLIINSPIKSIVDLYVNIFISSRNGIFEGVFFVSIGFLISNLIYNKKINYKYNFIIFIISYILLFLEILFIRNKVRLDDGSLYISFIFLIPSFVILLTNCKSKFKTRIFRNYSTGIYFMHRFILSLVVLLKFKSIYNFLITITILIILLTLFYKIDNKHLNKIIK